MKFYEKEKAEEQKRQIHTQQKGLCAFCKKPVPIGEAQAAHKIAKHKWIVKKYGDRVINHRFNLRITHSGRCNDGIMIMPESEQAQQLIAEIKEDLNE